MFGVDLATISVSPDPFSLCQPEIRFPRTRSREADIFDFLLCVQNLKIKAGECSVVSHDKKNESVNERDAIS